MTPQGPTRSQRGRPCPIRRLAVTRRTVSKGRAARRPADAGDCILRETCPLLELLVNGIHCILDGDSLEVSCRHLQAEREVQVDLLDWWLCEQLLQDVLVIDC